MQILVVGNGGREHALAWKLSLSPLAQKIWVAPGNAGTATENKTQNMAIDPLDIDGLIRFAKTQGIDFTIVGPEAPLALGIVDRFREQHLPCIGPTQKAAMIEGSKVFAKDFMIRHHIPTAKYATFHDLSAAKAYVKEQSYPLVIKDDGLAAGKGVVIADNIQHAFTTLDDMLLGKNVANKKVVIEEFLQGSEASLIVLTDGKNFIPLASAQDHKRRDDGDLGPNTGGMGAYSPAPQLTDAKLKWAYDRVITPTLQGMAKEGYPFQGFLYAGLMITPDDEIKVLEFNARLGDPETQVILPRLQSDLVRLCLSALKEDLNHFSVRWDERKALGVVLAAKGYPHEYPKNMRIHGLPNTTTTLEGNHMVSVFHAGTTISEGNVVTQGGRVLCVTALANDFAQAQHAAYQMIAKIHWEAMHFRRDIGYKVLS